MSELLELTWRVFQLNQKVIGLSAFVSYSHCERGSQFATNSRMGQYYAMYYLNVAVFFLFLMCMLPGDQGDVHKLLPDTISVCITASSQFAIAVGRRRISFGVIVSECVHRNDACDLSLFLALIFHYHFFIHSTLCRTSCASSHTSTHA